MGVEKEDDNKFELLLSEKRHKELIGSFQSVVAELKRDKKDMAVVAAIEKQLVSIKELITKVINIPKPEKPNVNVEVETNQKEVVASIEKMAAKILAGLDDIREYLILSSQPRQYEFKVNRDKIGYIDSVTVKDSILKINAQA